MSYPGEKTNPSAPPQVSAYPVSDPQGSIPVAQGIYTVDSNPIQVGYSQGQQQQQQYYGQQPQQQQQQYYQQQQQPQQVYQPQAQQVYQPQAQQVYQQQPQRQVVVYSVNSSFVCPHCRYSGSTQMRTVSGACTWLSCLITLCFCPLGCCLIPFCTDCTKDTEYYCPNCKSTVGINNRL